MGIWTEWILSFFAQYIFTIDNPEFEKHIPDIHLAKLLTQHLMFYRLAQL